MLATLASVAGAACGVIGVYAFAAGSSAGPPFDVTQAFSVFKTLPARPAPPGIGSPASLTSLRADPSQMRILRSDAGRFHSQLIIFPANHRRNLCYGVIPAASSDAGALYCYSPGNPSAPSEIAGEHFSVAALESVSNGAVGVQLLGVADDEVTSVRVQVAGAWRSVPISNNGFYLDLPGISYDQMGHLEATMKDESVQVHDIGTSTRLR